jgi:L-lactate dehydrogenase complex protein LldF
MATEEIHLNRHLEEAGYEPVETDLGEFVVQIDHDTPSHIVTPIIHKNRKEIATSFEREGLGPYTEVPEELAMQARAALRERFKQAKIGISGVNFATVDTGRIVLVENEGNNRFSTTAPDVHIALMGIEKMIPREADLPLFLKLLAGSATGQALTTYTHLISGPRRSDEIDGPTDVHLVLLDNGRSRVLKGPYRDILGCIRCGACLNVCPVYRQGSGHAYGHVYPGPLGAVLAPALEGVDKFGHLAKASTLCGACQEVCPVKIPIPDMLLLLREEGKRTRAVEDPAPWGVYAIGATHPTLWRVGLKMLPLAKALPHPMKSGWAEFKDLPKREGRNFRSWWAKHRNDAEDHVRTSMPGVHSEPRFEKPSNPVEPWQQFAERAILLGATIIEDIGEHVAGKLCYVDPDVPGLEGLNRTENVWEAEVGITLADLAIAETGSILVSARSGRSRLASLAPPIHIALVGAVVDTVEEAFSKLDNRTSVLITGTSRTADIEGILIRGVHGPKELLILKT